MVINIHILPLSEIIHPARLVSTCSVGWVFLRSIIYHDSIFRFIFSIINFNGLFNTISFISWVDKGSNFQLFLFYFAGVCTLNNSFRDAVNLNYLSLSLSVIFLIYKLWYTLLHKMFSSLP